MSINRRYRNNQTCNPFFFKCNFVIKNGPNINFIKKCLAILNHIQKHIFVLNLKMQKMNSEHAAAYSQPR